MALPKVSVRNLAAPNRRASRAGFTLIEVLIVTAMLALLGSLALIVNMDAYRGYAFRNERDAIVAALQRARNLAMSGECAGIIATDPSQCAIAGYCCSGADHGVHFGTSGYIIFQGAGFAERATGQDLVSQAGAGIVASSTADVIFQNLTGNVANASPTIDITVADTGRGASSTVSVNSVGQITWTN